MLVLALLCCLCSGVCPAASAFHSNGSYITPTRDATGREIVSVIENEYDSCTNIRHVVISAGVTVIGTKAFSNSSLTAVSLPVLLKSVNERSRPPS